MAVAFVSNHVPHTAAYMYSKNLPSLEKFMGHLGGSTTKCSKSYLQKTSYPHQQLLTKRSGNWNVEEWGTGIRRKQIDPPSMVQSMQYPLELLCHPLCNWSLVLG